MLTQLLRIKLIVPRLQIIAALFPGKRTQLIGLPLKSWPFTRYQRVQERFDFSCRLRSLGLQTQFDKIIEAQKLRLFVA
ncbi:hypothetical protein D3C75_1099460 [compost metagenome]